MSEGALETENVETTEGGARPGRLRCLFRLLALVLILVGLYALGAATGLSELSVDELRAKVDGAGWTGLIIFMAAFAIGLLIQVPGMLFVAAGILVYGRVVGSVVVLAGGLFALSMSFLVVRAIGGKALGEIKNRFMRRLLDRLESAPITTVALLRLCFQFSPPLNYALALSRIRFRDYFIGSAIGLAPVMLVIGLLFERFFG